jgi:ABC-type multidrug transport system ATPase subunit
MGSALAASASFSVSRLLATTWLRRATSETCCACVRRRSRATITTHFLEGTERIADRIGVIAGGRLIAKSLRRLALAGRIQRYRP